MFGRDGVGGGERGGGGVAAGRQRGGRRPTEGGSPRRRPAAGLAFDWFLLRFRFSFFLGGELMICSWGVSCCRGTRPRRCCPSRPSRSPPRPRSTSASSLRSFPSSCLRLQSLSCANHVVISTNLAAPLAFIYLKLRDCCLVSP